jgi:hypothetical protein
MQRGNGREESASGLDGDSSVPGQSAGADTISLVVGREEYGGGSTREKGWERKK